MSYIRSDVGIQYLALCCPENPQHVEGDDDTLKMIMIISLQLPKGKSGICDNYLLSR